MRLRFWVLYIVAITVLIAVTAFRYQNVSNPVPQVAAVQTTVDIESKQSVQPLTEAVNVARTVTGATELSEDVSLNKLALARARDMVDRDYYAHVNPDGESFVELLPKYGYVKPTFACENLDMLTSDDLSQVITDWSNSSSHNACLQNSQTSKIGVGIAKMGDVAYSSGIKTTYIVVVILSTR